MGATALLLITPSSHKRYLPTVAMSRLLVLLALVSLSSAFVVPNAVFHTYRSQDELGGYHFGYSGGPSSRAEQRDHLGVVRGAYNLIDANGNVQKYQYISDALGYRIISGTHLPVVPTVSVVGTPVVTLEGPEPVQETPEVAEARAAFDVLYKKAADAAAAATLKAAEPSPVSADASPVDTTPVESSPVATTA